MFTAIFILVNVYIFIRGRNVLQDNSLLQILYTLIFLSILVTSILGFYFSNRLPAISGNIFILISRYWIFLLIIYLMAAFFSDILRLSNYYFEIYPEWVIKNYSQVKFSYFLVVIISSLVILLTGFILYSNPRTVELNISLHKDKDQCKDLNIIAASDLHLGAINHKDRLTDWVTMINRQNPDIILLAGDIFDRSFAVHDSQEIIGELRKLKSKYGIYAILGNHDYYLQADNSIGYFESSGIRLLRDQSVIINNRFVLIGRDDIHNRSRKTVDLLISEIDPRLPVILMDHRPEDLEGSVRNNIDLHISGHTHNGQIFPGNYLAKLKWELVYGYRKIGDSHFYVSSGLGLSYIPMRIGTRSEIVKITLEGSSSGKTNDNYRSSNCLIK